MRLIREWEKVIIMKILFLITARGGSKGVPRKNIRLLGNLPLIAFKINAAKKCKYDNRIIVSTDDEEIANVAKEYGAEVPFMRPSYLAEDNSSSMDVVKHAIAWLNENDDSVYDYICLLEPSSPFATADDLNSAIDLIIDSGADTLLGMKEVEVSKRFIFPLDKNGKLSYFYDSIMQLSSMRRQDMGKEYTMNGCMYIAKMDYFNKNNIFHSINSVPYIMPNIKSVEIDSMDDYNYAKYLVDNNIIDIKEWQ